VNIVLSIQVYKRWKFVKNIIADLLCSRRPVLSKHHSFLITDTRIEGGGVDADDDADDDDDNNNNNYNININTNWLWWW
jgi:hypothetical protein